MPKAASKPLLVSSYIVVFSGVLMVLSEVIAIEFVVLAALVDLSQLTWVGWSIALGVLGVPIAWLGYRFTKHALAAEAEHSA